MHRRPRDVVVKFLSYIGSCVPLSLVYIYDFSTVTLIRRDDPRIDFSSKRATYIQLATILSLAGEN